MIAVVLLDQAFDHLLLVQSQGLCHVGHRFVELRYQFVLGNAANGIVLAVHADVHWLVKAAEHAHLRELGHAREQHKLQMRVGCLEGGVEALERFAVAILDKAHFAVHLHFVVRVHHVEQRLVVLVNQHHAAFARGVVHVCQQFTKPLAVGIICVRLKAILLFPTLDKPFHNALQGPGLSKVRAVKVHVKHRVALPVLFERIDGQSLEQFALPLKVVFERRHKQTLAKSPRATQKVGLSAFHELVNQVGLVYVEISIFDDALKVLYANGKFHKFRDYWFIGSKRFTMRQSSTSHSSMVPVCDEKLAPTLCRWRLSAA